MNGPKDKELKGLTNTHKNTLLKSRDQLDNQRETLQKHMDEIESSKELEFMPTYIVKGTKKVGADLMIALAEQDLYVSGGFQPTSDFSFVAVKERQGELKEQAKSQIKKVNVQRAAAMAEIGGGEESTAQTAVA